MATVHRDLIFPPGWLPGAEFRLTASEVRVRRDGTLRDSGGQRDFVHRFYEGAPDGTSARLPIPQTELRIDVTAVHRITATHVDAKWTAVQFCPAPDQCPWQKVWANVRCWNSWWAELVNPLDTFHDTANKRRRIMTR